MDSNSYLKAMLVQFVLNEPQEDGLNGALGVMLVIANRARSGWHGGDYLKILETAPLFSYRAIPLTPTKLAYGDIRSPLVQKILWRVDAVLAGSELDFTKGSLYYARLNEVTSDFFRQEILEHLDRHPRVAETGHLTFFR